MPAGAARPGDQTQPSIDITTYLAYDDENLYVAYVIEDDPAAIRANLSDRDAIWQDDYAGMILDPNGDGQSLYFIASNALGIQGDTRISPNNEDMGFNLIFKSEGKITDTGYQIEMAIPFKSLRFPNTDVQTWRATFWITHPRESRNTYSWAAMSRDNPCWSCQFGTLNGIVGVKSGKNLEILPAFTGAQAGALNDAGDPDSGFDDGRIDIEPSLNLKYGITSELTLDATINPDFSQIESDVAQIDVNSTFALFFPERRPFFQEGADLFNTEIQTVYTRSINDPIVANKLTGRFGSTNVAYIGARDNTSPLMLVVFFFLGSAAGMLNVYRVATGRGFAVGYGEGTGGDAEPGEARPEDTGSGKNGSEKNAPRNDKAADENRGDES